VISASGNSVWFLKRSMRHDMVPRGGGSHTPCGLWPALRRLPLQACRPCLEAQRMCQNCLVVSGAFSKPHGCSFSYPPPSTTGCRQRSSLQPATILFAHPLDPVWPPFLEIADNQCRAGDSQARLGRQSCKLAKVRRLPVAC
jgi:hypothetical protein